MTLAPKAALVACSPAVLHVQLFGDVELRRGGKLLVAPSNSRERRLLAYLALEGPASREQIGGALWPDSTEENAKASVRTTLSVLKAEVGDDEQYAQCFVADEHATGLRCELGTTVDFNEAIDALEAGAVDRARDLSRAPLLRGCSGQWENALRERWQDALEAAARAEGRDVAVGTPQNASEYSSTDELDLRARPVPRRRRVRRSWLAVGLLGGMLAAIGAVAVSGRSGDGSQERPAAACPPGAARPDPSDERVSTVREGGSRPASRAKAEVGLRPASLAIAREGVWVAYRGGLGLIDPRTLRRSMPTIPVADSATAENAPFSIAVARDRVWVTRRDGVLVAIDRSTRERTAPTVRYGRGPATVALAGGGVWINNFQDGHDGSITRVDPCTGRVERLKIGRSANTVYPAFGSLWVTNSVDGSLERLDPLRRRKVASITGLQDPQDVVAASGLLWVIEYAGQKLQRVDPRTNQLVGGPIRVGPDPAGLAVGAGAIWVSLYGNGTLTRVDLRTGRSRLAVSSVGQSPTDAAVGYGRVWVPNNDGDTVTAVRPRSWSGAGGGRAARRAASRAPRR